MQSSRPFRPVSAKRPHWVLLGFKRALCRPGIQRHTVLGTPLVSFAEHATGELHVLDEACPHRGASLANGTVHDKCVVCPYHHKHIGVTTFPGTFYNYVATQGMVWLDLARDVFTQHHMPPVMPELSSPLFTTVELTKEVHASPLVLLEHLVEALSMAVSPTSTEYSHGSHVGKATYMFATPYGPLTVQAEFHVPYTCHLRMQLGEETAAIALASVLPQSPTHAKLHICIGRNTSTKPWTHWVTRVCRLVLQLVLLQIDVVSTVDVRKWRQGSLDASDAFLAMYRSSLEELFPEVTRYMVYDDAMTMPNE